MARKSIEKIDPTKLRYFLYTRKSTEDKGSQERSIEDQIKDCEALMEREHIQAIKPYIREEKSAKIENNRSQFSRMIKQIKEGKADGIIAWHPDRLSRNPIESAIIIDLLDKGIIKDLKFATCQFSNDSSGKMLLNILFAISKQYSEHISEGVLRANESALEEGKSNGVPKWGYDRNKDGYYRPDDNFPFIRAAWEMKLAGDSHTVILDYLLKSDVHRMTKLTRKNKTQRRIDPNLNGLKTMFEDPFYYGLLVQASQEVDLVKATDGAFEPMISYDEYVAVQAMGGGKSHRVKKRVKYLPLRGLVKCGVCGRIMTPAVSGGNGGQYLYYRCDNKECNREPHNVRASIIFEPLFETIRSFNFTEEEYKTYSDKVDSLTEEKIVELRTERKSLEAKLAYKKTEVRKLSKVLSDVSKSGIKIAIREAEADLESASDSVADLEIRIDEITQKIDGTSQIALSKDEFLNLLKMLPDKIENASIAEKDAFVRMMLLNLTIDNEKRPHFLWKEPFKTLLETQQFLTGARDWTRTSKPCGTCS